MLPGADGIDSQELGRCPVGRSKMRKDPQKWAGRMKKEGNNNEQWGKENKNNKGESRKERSKGGMNVRNNNLDDPLIHATGIFSKSISAQFIIHNS